MSATRRKSLVFFMGQRAFRTPRTMRKVLVRFAVSAVAFSIVAVGLARQPPLAEYLVVTAVIAGTIALATGAGLLTAFALARVDKLTISDRGVRYGDRFWKWGRLRAFRARRSQPSEPIQLLIWDGEDKGPGRFLAIDEPVSPELATDLMERVRQYCSKNHLKVNCEASC